MDILVSACLLGTPCRYDGASRPCGELARLEVLGHRLIPVCPEVMGGLPTPRPPAELQRDGRVVDRAAREEGQSASRPLPSKYPGKND